MARQCSFCNRWFRNKQAVRAHLRRCETYLDTKRDAAPGLLARLGLSGRSPGSALAPRELPPPTLIPLEQSPLARELTAEVHGFPPSALEVAAMNRPPGLGPRPPAEPIVGLAVCVECGSRSSEMRVCSRCSSRRWILAQDNPIECRECGTWQASANPSWDGHCTECGEPIDASPH